MKFSNFMILNTVIALVFGIAFVVVPGTVLGIYGMNPGPDANLAAQYFGTALIAIGLLCWFARNLSDAAAKGAIVLALLISNVIGLIVSIIGTLGGVMNAVGWSAVVIYLVLALGYAYFQFMKTP
jgi:hypothetical protein